MKDSTELSRPHFRISEDEFKKAQGVIHDYWEERQRQAEWDLEEDEPDYEPEPCSVCGDIEGMVNPCCPGYDPLHYKNCGYG